MSTNIITLNWARQRMRALEARLSIKPHSGPLCIAHRRGAWHGDWHGSLLRTKIALGTALGLAFASDTASISIMEIVDKAVMLVITGAMDTGLTSPLFWGSLAFSMIVAGIAAFPVNHWLIGRGLGHAVVHRYH